MSASTPLRPRLVLHVLPHPGGGGEAYVDAVSKLPGYRAERFFLARGPAPLRAAPVLVPNAIRAHLKAGAADLVHVHGEVAAALSLPMLGRRPSVVTLHGLNLLRRSRGARYRLAQRNLRAIATRAGSVICTSQAEFDEVTAVLSPELRSRVLVIHNGVVPRAPASAEEVASARREFGVDGSATVALYAGGLEEVKEPLVAVRAAVDAGRRGARLVLLVAGDGPLRSAVGTEGGEHVRVLGFRHDVSRLNSVADVFVLPSRREGLSYALLDAMAAGTAPVVSDIPGNVEAVGESGVVVPGGDIAAFADALVELAMDRATLERLGTEARARVEREFREDVMLARTGDVYDAIVAERSPS